MYSLFNIVATALGFSPTMKNVLRETHRICTLYNSKMILIHVGEKTEDKQIKVDKLLFELGISKEDTTIIWEQGKVKDIVIKNIKKYNVNLLVIGALERETLFKKYFGSIARDISRNITCSLLMLTHFNESGKSFEKIVVNGSQHKRTPMSIDTAIKIAKFEQAKELYIVKEIYIPNLSSTLEDDTDQKRKEIKQRYIHQINTICNNYINNSAYAKDVNIKSRVIFGKEGFSISNFAKTKKADLLVINAPDKKLFMIDRLFPYHIEYILADLPCNVLIIK